MHSVTCYDVCKMNAQLEDMTEELRILVDEITAVGSKCEVKIVQWTCGFSLQRTSEIINMIRQFSLMVFSKEQVRFGKLIRQSHVNGFIEKELESIIKRVGNILSRGC